jgi:AraC family transcriptional activator of tynA and feaB
MGDPSLPSNTERTLLTARGLLMPNLPAFPGFAQTYPIGFLSATSRPEMSIDEVVSRLRAACGNFLAEPMMRQQSVAGGIEMRRCGSIDVATIGQNLKCISRDAHAIRVDDREHFFLVFQEHGSALMCQGEQQIDAKAGDFVLIDSARPSAFIYGGRMSHQISIHLPRSDFVARFGRAAEGGICVRSRDALGFAMRAILARMLAGGQTGDTHLGEAFLGVLGAVLSERNRQLPVPSRSAGEGVLRRALQQVALRFQDPDFKARDLARQLGVSLRLLQRAFRSLGVSPSRHILDVRLTAARATLEASAQRSGPASPVSAAAYENGFNDLSFFYREFRNRYGTSPGCALRQTEGREKMTPESSR